MIRFIEAYAENYGTFKKICLPLDGQGLVSIKGDNRDTRGSNGAGKSVGTGDLIESLLYGTNSKGFNLPKMIPDGKGFTGRIKWERNNSIYEVVHWRNHKDFPKGIGIKILKDDENVAEGNNTTQILKQIPKHLGYTRQEFRGSVLLASNATHVLLNGTNTERFGFLDGPFKLSQYTRLYKRFKEELKDIDTRIQKLELIESKRERAKEELDKVGNIDKLRKKVNSLRSQFKAFKNKRKMMEDSLEEIVSKLSVLKSIDPSSINEDTAKLKETIEESKNQLEKIEARRRKADKKLDKATEYIQIKKQLDNLKGVAGKKFDKLASKYTQLIADAKAERKTHVDTIKVFDKVTGKKECPTCHREFSSKEEKRIKELVDNAKKKSKSIKKEIVKLEEALESFEEQKEQAQEYKALKAKLPENLKDEDLDTDKIERILVGAETASKQIKEYHDKAIAQLTKASQSRKRLKKLGITVGDVKSEITSLKSKRKKFKTVVTGLKDEENTLSADIQKFKTRITSYDDLVDEVSGYDKKLKLRNKLEYRRRIYQGLEQAYGPRGLKLEKVRDIIKVFQSRLPEFTSCLFTERGVKFTIKGNDKELGFEIKRPGKPAFDIRGLSGGEARRMNLALILMVKKSMPVEKASNLVILDEVDMNVDLIGRSVFSNVLLPALKNTIGTLLVISHNVDVSESPNFDRHWTFVKKDNISKLKR